MPQDSLQQSFPHRSAVDIAVIGAGAAGLMAATWAARTLRQLDPDSNPRRIVAFDGARTLGAKVLVAGGGRCNVTHHKVTAEDYAGGSRNTIKRVLSRFTVEDTVGFFRALGVELKHEETGKLFPTTDRARDVLNALLLAADRAGASVQHPVRIDTVAYDPSTGFFTLAAPTHAPAGIPNAQQFSCVARRVILCTGGKSLPKTGSDGHGYTIAKLLGHTVTQHVFPSLVPLLLGKESPLPALRGLTLPARFEVRTATGKRLVSFTGSTLCTHFGLSGPAVLNISRYYTAAKHTDSGATLTVSFLPDSTPESFAQEILAPRNANRSTHRFLAERLPARLAQVLCDTAGIPESLSVGQCTKQQRRDLTRFTCDHALSITGDRGYKFAEATAGGVPLPEIDPKTMASRAHPGLYLAGEVCDVDGRIGGFNFQWAWASGHLAGTAAAHSLLSAPSRTIDA